LEEAADALFLPDKTRAVEEAAHARVCGFTIVDTLQKVSLSKTCKEGRRTFVS
jgi:hypothetical protein